jgi:hypothetical protein
VVVGRSEVTVLVRTEVVVATVDVIASSEIVETAGVIRLLECFACLVLRTVKVVVVTMPV